jgi:hypothetical protein
LGTKLRDICRSIAASMPCPVDYPAVMMLPVLGALIGRKVGICPKPGWVEYALVWCMIVAETGYRKTPVFKIITKSLRTLDARLKEDYEQSKREYETLDADERKHSSPPLRKRLFTTDSTMEALHKVLSTNPKGGSLSLR